METSDIIKILGITSGPQIILLFLVVIWGKRFVEYFFNKTIELKKFELGKNLESHRQFIEQENKLIQLSLDKNLENYKSKLEVLKLEFQVQLSQLYTKRYEIIAELYKHLSELNASLLDMTSSIHPIIADAEKEEKERIDRANNAFYHFSTHYIPNKIFFPKAISDKLDHIQKFHWSKSWDYQYIRNEVLRKNIPHETWKEFFGKSIELSQKVREEIPVLLEEIETEFRQLLGVIPVNHEILK